MPRWRRASDCRTREQLDALRTSRREEARRRRARFKARGLSHAGAPLKNAAIANAVFVSKGACPIGCICFDCLGFSRDDRRARAAVPCRVMGSDDGNL